MNFRSLTRNQSQFSASRTSLSFSSVQIPLQCQKIRAKDKSKTIARLTYANSLCTHNLEAETNRKFARSFVVGAHEEV